MTTHQLAETLEPIANGLNAKVSRRENLIKESRAVISYASKCIVNIHTGKTGEAEKCLEEAKTLLTQLRKFAGADLTRYLISPETEYVEADTVVSIASNQPIPQQTTLGVSNEAYLLGLLDAVGELKRMVYDSIRRGNIEQASDLFNIMENIYIHLSPFAIYDNVVDGLRRKLDVARNIIETTRATITEETRRGEFIKNMENLVQQLPQQQQ
jgi:translin